MSDPGIIQLGPSHIKALAQLERACFSAPWREEDFARAMGIPFFTALGVMEGEVLAAYISLSHPPGEMEVLNIATREDRRRHGLGRALLVRALALLPALGAESAFLEVRENNTPAKNLYFSLGFRQCGRRKGYYPDTGEDALVFAYGAESCIFPSGTCPAGLLPPGS